MGQIVRRNVSNVGDIEFFEIKMPSWGSPTKCFWDPNAGVQTEGECERPAPGTVVEFVDGTRGRTLMTHVLDDTHAWGKYMPEYGLWTVVGHADGSFEQFLTPTSQIQVVK